MKNISSLIFVTKNTFCCSDISLSYSRLCHVWHPQPVCGCVVTTDAHEALSGCNHLGCIAMMPIASCMPFPFFASCDDMLTMLVCATHWLYMHLYTLTYMSMHESCLLVCRPCSNIMKLWTADPNLHLSLADTSFCLLSRLFSLLLVCLLPCFFACNAYYAYLLYVQLLPLGYVLF